MSMSLSDHQEENVKERVLNAVDETDPKDFNEIHDEVEQAEEKEAREALLDLVDANQVVVNANWEYRRRSDSER